MHARSAIVLRITCLQLSPFGVNALPVVCGWLPLLLPMGMHSQCLSLKYAQAVPVGQHTLVLGTTSPDDVSLVLLLWLQTSQAATCGIDSQQTVCSV